MYDVVYFSNISENTKKFVTKLDATSYRIPVKNGEEPFVVSKEYVLVLPTYGGIHEGKHVPRQVIEFFKIKKNSDLLRGVVGTGNTNFGETYCKAAEIVSARFGVPLLYRVELLGTPYDVEQVNERLKQLWTTTAITN
jgi:protein involved in ribonucleotide reduction